MVKSESAAHKTTTDAITIDELLAKQEEVRLVGTLQPVAGDLESLKFTPAGGGSYCLCEFAIIIPKAVIAEVIPTGETHLCCGKRLEFVEIRFSDNSQIPAESVIKQLVQSVGTRHADVHAPARPSLPPNFNARATAGTCICDHFIRRYCSNGQLYEDYWCYDETGAFCGTTTVPLGVPCPENNLLNNVPSLRGGREVNRTTYNSPAFAPGRPSMAQPFGRAAMTAQWSGYITLTADNGSQITFYVGCFGDGPYVIDKSQITYIDQRGICGNYGAYYIVFNY